MNIPIQSIKIEKRNGPLLGTCYGYRDSERASELVARRRVQTAKQTLRLIEPSRCSICSFCSMFTPLHAHHQDYNKPLDVDWLCPTCHRRIRDAVNEIIEVAKC